MKRFSLRATLLKLKEGGLLPFAIVSSLVLIPICSLPFYLGYLGYKGYLEYPRYSSEPFVFEPGQRRFEFDVLHECFLYRIGVIFSSRKDGYDGDRDVQRVFGNGMNPHLPARADVFLYDEHGQMVFPKTDFGGASNGDGVGAMAYGPDPIDFYAGISGHLKPGKYVADIHIKQADNDLSRFDAQLTIAEFSQPFTCGAKKDQLMYYILFWYWLFTGSNWFNW